MSTLATLRAAGVRPYLKGDGIAVTGTVSPTLLHQLRSHRHQIIAVLSAEVMDGVAYCDSALFVLVDRHFDHWYKQTDSQERTAALSLISKWDDALWMDLAQGAKVVLADWPIMAQLIENRPLAGAALYSLAKGIADQIEPPRPAVIVDAAKSETAITPPKPEPRQDGFGFFDPLPKRPVGDTSVFD